MLKCMLYSLATRYVCMLYTFYINQQLHINIVIVVMLYYYSSLFCHSHTIVQCLY